VLDLFDRPLYSELWNQISIEVAKNTQNSEVKTSISNFYSNELVYFECKSIYFLVTIGYSWTVVFDNGTESADENIFVNGTGFRSWVFYLVNRELKFGPKFLIE